MKVNFKSLFTAILVFIITIAVVSATLSAPTSYSRGYKLYGTYWDFMGELGLRNGTLDNMSFEPLNTSAKSTAIVLFNYSAGTMVGFEKNITFANETYQFQNNSGGNRMVNLTGLNQTMTYACAQFVTEVNTNSSNATASSCSANSTTLTYKYLGNEGNSITIVTNETNITVPATFASGADYRPTYIDATGTSDANASNQDMVFRSTDTLGNLVERFRLKVNTASDIGFVADSLTVTNLVTTGSLNVTTASLIGTKEVHWIPVRFVAGGAVQMNKMYFPYNVTIDKFRGVVAVDIGATDNGTIVFANSTGNMTSGTITAVANDTVGTEYTAIPTTNNTVVKDSYMTINLTKTTGDGQVMLGIEMTRTV